MIKSFLKTIILFFALFVSTIEASSPSDWSTSIHPYEKPFYSMMDAVFYNDYQKVEELLKSGISPKMETAYGITPINLAIDLNHDSIFNLLTKNKSPYDHQYLYFKAIKDGDLQQLKKYHKAGNFPLLCADPSYFKSPYRAKLLEYLIPTFQKCSQEKNFFSNIPLPQTQKEAKELASLMRLMILNGFFPNSPLDSLWLETIAKRSIDSSSFSLPKKENISKKTNTKINSALDYVSSINAIDSLLVIGADPLGPTDRPNTHAFDRRHRNPYPFDWKVISFFQKRDPVRIKPLLKGDDFFFIALAEGDLNEVKKRLAKIDLHKKDSSFLKMILPTATYSGNVELIKYLKTLSIPFHEQNWKISFSDAFNSKDFDLIKTLFFMHPDSQKASQYIRDMYKPIFSFNDFYQKFKILNQLLSLKIPTKPFEGETYSFLDNKIKIRYNPKTNQFEPFWEFEGLYSYLSDDFYSNRMYFRAPSSRSWKPIDIEKPIPIKDLKESQEPQTTNYWEFSGDFNKCPVYAIVEYENQLFASTQCLQMIKSNDGGMTWEGINYSNTPFSSLIVHQDRLFGSTFSIWGTESVFEITKNDDRRRMSFGLYRELDTLKTKKNRLFSISNTLYFADSAVQKTYRFDFETYTWNEADTSLIEFIDEKNSSIGDTLKSKNGTPLALKKHVYQTLQYKQRLFAATEKGLLFSNNQGIHWSFAPIKNHYRNPINLFATDIKISFTDNDSLFFSENGGYYWVGVPADNLLMYSTAQIDSTHFVATNTGLIRISPKEKPQMAINNYTIVKSIAFFDNILWAASGDDGTRLSLDSGITWDLARCFTPSYPAIYKFFQKENNLYAATDRGVYEYQKTKSCWSRKPTNGLIDRKTLTLAASDKELFALNSSGKIYTAKIPVKKWAPLSQKINNSFFVVSDILYHKNILIAATDKGPLFSYNQGKSWTLYKTGLPKNPEVKSIAIFKNTLFAIIDDNVYRFDLSQK